MTRDDKAVPAPDPGKYLKKSVGLKVRTLAEDIEGVGLIGSDEIEELYYYVDGVWRRGGNREVHDRTRILLDQRYRPAHGNAVSKWFSVRPPVISDSSANTKYLNLPDGLLNWRTGRLRKHSPKVASLARIPVEWDPDATCPHINDWVREVIPADCIELFYEIAGYMLYNGNPLHKAILLHGTGRNGKGAMLRLLGRLAGAANVSALTPQSLDENRFAAAELRGKLANLVGDVDPRIFKATERFKQATGGDLMEAERKYGHPFTFTCRALMVAAFNSYPRSADSTEGFFSRWVVLPFTGYFPAGVAEPSVEDKMHDPAELRGLLVEAVEGLRRVMGRGEFKTPESVKREMRTFREAADPVRAFMSDAMVPGDHVRRTDVYDAWAAWALANGHEVGSARRLYERLPGAALDVLGVQAEEGKSHGERVFRGVGVAATRKAERYG